MATYSPSKITKDGNTYNFTDTTKIPLAGTNALSGSIIPSTDNAYYFGNISKRFAYTFTNNLFASFIYTYNDTSQVTIYGSSSYQNGAEVTVYGKDHPYKSGCVYLVARDGTNTKTFIAKPDGTLTWGSKNVAMQEDVVPRSGGAVMTGTKIACTDATKEMNYCGGTSQDDGATLILAGKNASSNMGCACIRPNNGSNSKYNWMRPDGTWTWNGTACQIVSDQRYKQQINAIDDKLLDAWKDVTLVQFKYNDAVKEKSDNARLHTGYVVQQIDEACKSHNVDISEYGLYCHEEYPQETEEVEVEQADGTKTKETKVIREASEHYSLRYTEALIVECAYLRKCIKELRSEIEQLKSSK